MILKEYVCMHVLKARYALAFPSAKVLVYDSHYCEDHRIEVETQLYKVGIQQAWSKFENKLIILNYLNN